MPDPVPTDPPVNPTPTPTDPTAVSLDDLEKTLDAVLAADPAVLTRLTGFFGKLRQAKPKLDQFLAALSSLR
jgi:hypothetical protein